MARNQQHEQTPVDDDSYDVSEIPPEAPEGKWLATPKAELKKSSKGWPMIQINWKLDEALTDGNEDAVGGRLADYLVWLPKDSGGYRLSLQRIQALCTHLQIPTKGSRQELSDAINDAGQSEIWTLHRTDKTTGEVQTQVAYRQPAALGGGTPPVEQEEEEKPRGRAGAKKAAGGRR
jgi:hypothetical protein